MIDPTPMTPIEAITDETLRQMAAEAKSFLLGHRWCQSVRQGYLDRAWPGILAIFYFEIVSAPHSSADDAVWVIVGDLPPAYIDIGSCRDGIAALEGYVGAMWGWVEAVKEGRSVEEEIPVYYRYSFLEVPPTLEFALMLEQRLCFIEDHLLPPVASEGED
ncbi:MAG: hypothetical protein QXI19_13595 [Candidatus Caldarchaeum sp.]